MALASRLAASGRPEEAERVLKKGTEAEERWLAAVSYVDLANFYSDREEHARAAEALAKAVELSEDPRPELRFQYAETLVMAGELERARELARSFDVPAYRELIEARVLVAEGKPKEALAHFDEGLRLWPDNAVARYYAARAAEAAGDFERAVAEYRYSIRAGPSLTDARYRLARLHEAEGALEAALVVARQRTATEPADSQAERVGLRVLARMGRLADARRIVAARAQDPTHIAGDVAAVAQGVRARRGPADAARLVRESERLDLRDARDADALRELIVSLIEAGDVPAAAAAADAAVAQDSQVAALHALRGRALAARGDAAGARAAFERALALDARNAPALAGLARLAAAQADVEAALAYYARAAEASRDELGDMEPRREWAELLVAQARRDDAEVRLSELLDLDPYDGTAAARLAGLRLERGQHGDDVLALARRAARFGGRPESFELLAAVLRARGETEPAAQALAQAERVRAAPRQ
jgi:tetratricopeptide (TPR) repeat protein